VLQGAPGVGKTRMANLIGTNYYIENNNYNLNKDNVIKFDDLFFVQFHAETTYADFIGGIRPKLGNKSDHLEYEYKEGILTEAIKTAEKALKLADDVTKAKKYLLIIDEINRANLANVLGPVFYLFEQGSENRKGKVLLETNSGEPLPINKMPENLYVIATMNTADRSLAVVDFALRRRFTWYTLHAREIEDHELQKNEYFHRESFKEIELLFEKYASDEELNLQPGNGYFILKKKNIIPDQKIDDEIDEYKEEMGDRLTYEIMPLMKEYFTEGLLIKAQDEFANYYYKMTKKYMYW
jgi:5-methylcytosine-specific restriction protein B